MSFLKAALLLLICSVSVSVNGSPNATDLNTQEETSIAATKSAIIETTAETASHATTIVQCGEEICSENQICCDKWEDYYDLSTPNCCNKQTTSTSDANPTTTSLNLCTDCDGAGMTCVYVAFWNSYTCKKEVTEQQSTTTATTTTTTAISSTGDLTGTACGETTCGEYQKCCRDEWGGLYCMGNYEHCSSPYPSELKVCNGKTCSADLTACCFDEFGLAFCCSSTSSVTTTTTEDPGKTCGYETCGEFQKCCRALNILYCVASNDYCASPYTPKVCGGITCSVGQDVCCNGFFGNLVCCTSTTTTQSTTTTTEWGDYVNEDYSEHWDDANNESDNLNYPDPGALTTFIVLPIALIVVLLAVLRVWVRVRNRRINGRVLTGVRTTVTRRFAIPVVTTASHIPYQHLQNAAESTSEQLKETTRQAPPAYDDIA